MMKLSIVLLVALAVVVSATEPEVATTTSSSATVVSSSTLSAQQKEDVFDNAIAHISHLDVKVHECMEAFLRDLKLHETYVKVEGHIKNGHSIRYKKVDGSANLEDIAEKHGLEIKDGYISTKNDSPDVVSAHYVPSQRKNRAGMKADGSKTLNPTESGEESTVEESTHSPTLESLEAKNATHDGTVPLTDAKKQWYADNNKAQISKMEPKIQAFVTKVVEAVAADGVTIQLESPVPKGHSVRYVVVEGDESVPAKHACCGVTIADDTITAPEGDAVEAEDALEHDENGHVTVEEVSESSNGVPEKVQVVPKSKRNVVAKLPDKWMRFKQEKSDDADAFLEADSDADSLLEETPKATTPAATATPAAPAAAAPKADSDADSLLEEAPVAPATPAATPAAAAAPKADADADSLLEEEAPVATPVAATPAAPAAAPKADSDADSLLEEEAPVATGTTEVVSHQSNTDQEPAASSDSDAFLFLN